MINRKLLYSYAVLAVYSMYCVMPLANGGPVSCDPPTDLSCEFLTAPEQTGIFDSHPEFAWVCGSPGSEYTQSAYQIVVKRAGTKTDDPADVVWDSGRVNKGNSINIAYAGDELNANAKYAWHVRTWDTNGNASDWSAWQRFNMAGTLNATTTSRYDVKAIPQHPVRIEPRDNGVLFVDFGEDAFGYLQISLPTAFDRDQELVVHFGEKLEGNRIDRKPGGTIRYYRVEVPVPAGETSITVRPPKNRRNTGGKAIKLPESIGVIAPFRYVEIAGAPADLQAENLVQLRMEYPFDDSAASFVSSDETLNAIWDICKYSIRATTYCGVYVDGDRERIPYEADAYINQLSHYGVDREYALARYSHEYLLENPTWPTEWKQHSILMAWEDYMHTGNTESLAANYEILKQQKLLSAAERQDGLLQTDGEGYRDIVDWPRGERDGHEMRPVNTVVNAFHYECLLRMSDIAGVLGHAADAQQFAAKAKTLKQVFNAKLWDPATQAYIDGLGSDHSSMHSNLFPLAFGLVPDDRVADVIQFLKTRKMQCSVYAAQFLLEGLYENGAQDHALKLLTSKSDRSWFNMIRSGSTITLESWDKRDKGNLDWNHAWGAAPANLIPRYLVGVRPLEAGHNKIVIQPRPSTLESFTAKVPTLRGAVAVRYSAAAEQYDLTVTVPGNTTAKVGLPQINNKQAHQVICNDTAVSTNDDSTHLWIDNMPPGTHSFRVTLKEAASEVSDSQPTAIQSAN